MFYTGIRTGGLYYCFQVLFVKNLIDLDTRDKQFYNCLHKYTSSFHILCKYSKSLISQNDKLNFVPINVKTAELIEPNFFNGKSHDPIKGT